MGVSRLHVCLCGLALLSPAVVLANSDQAEYAIEGKYFDALDQPTYQIDSDGSVDWYTATGFQAYHQSCDSCHGPNGAGSAYGLALTDAARTMRHFDFTDTVVNGQILQSEGRTRIMPAFGTNSEVMCRLDAIYVYLRAKAAGVLTAESGVGKSRKNAAAKAVLDDCLSQ